MNKLRNWGAATIGTLSAGLASAQATDPFTAMLGAVDLSAIAVGVVAAGLLVVGIALAFKAPDVAKRVVRKV